MTEEEQRGRNERVDNELKILAEAVQDLVRVARQHENRISVTEDLGRQLVAMQIRADERADRADARAAEADARMNRFGDRMDKFGERLDSFNDRLDRFLDNFERYLNGAGGNGANGG